MGHHGFTQLPSLPNESWMVPTIRRRRPFSRVELCLLVPLTAFAAILAVFTTIYLIRHHDTVKPVAIAALCCTSLLLVGVGYIISRRLQRPEWHRDVEAGSLQKWQISAPLQASPATKQTTLDSKGFYAAISENRPSTPGKLTLSSKVRLAMKRTFSSGLLSQRSVESLQGRQEDRAVLIRQLADGESRSSSDSSEDEAGEGLWRSVFELAGDARLEQLRRANLKRLSKESRHSTYEMSGWDSRESNSVGIIVTKPQPTASSIHGRRTSLADLRSLREVSLAFDPLRANPVQLSRDASMRQTKSSHDLPSLLRSTDRTAPSIRRPRSAEPHPSCEDRLTPLTGGKSNRLSPAVPSLPASQLMSARPRVPAGGPRGLRRLPNPSDHDLREVFRTGDEVLG
jgi:hypothetical protein